MLRLHECWLVEPSRDNDVSPSSLARTNLGGDAASLERQTGDCSVCPRRRDPRLPGLMPEALHGERDADHNL